MSEPGFLRLLENKEDAILIMDKIKASDFVFNVLLDNRSVCYVSDSFPLLSNLNVIENITLSNMFHENETLQQAAAKVTPFIENLGMQDAILKRKESLSREEIIRTCLLRAVSRGSDVIMTDFAKAGELNILKDSLVKINKRLFLWIMCLEKDLGNYNDFAFKTVRLAGYKL